ncbi:MAG TPA: 3'-5' exoribonuclease [Candidatus Eisenbacteria bacterium]|nr:3'-5' exoribonuclease [Candidatus Eisenbacteria bacterium]
MEEILISTDIETTGPAPGRDLYSMYQLGSCVVGDLSQTFYAEIELISSRFIPEALAACGTTMAELRDKGDDPMAVMLRYADWVEKIAKGRKPVFTAFGATFDWMFIEWYFQTFTGSNPFGHCGQDIKSYYQGMMRCSWDATKLSKIDPRFLSEKPHTHNALDDAIQQADMFAKMLAYKP